MEAKIDYKTTENARVLFVGINPHPGSERRGVPFSNNKMFWYLLNRAGLLREPPADLKDDRKLKNIYDNKFAQFYKLNFVNLVDRATVNVTGLRKGEEQAGVQRLLKTIRELSPEVVCFIGKIALTTFQGSRTCQWGWQPDIEGSKAYLMHFPIRGPATVRIEELREVVGMPRIKTQTTPEKYN